MTTPTPLHNASTVYDDLPPHFEGFFFDTYLSCPFYINAYPSYGDLRHISRQPLFVRGLNFWTMPSLFMRVFFFNLMPTPLHEGFKFLDHTTPLRDGFFLQFNIYPSGLSLCQPYNYDYFFLGQLLFLF